MIGTLKGNLTEGRIGNWLQTYSGIAFWPMDPREDEIIMEDIAHSLSLQCRYAGHVRTFYSVAQHAVLVARIVPEEHRAWGLMHDASEAYLVDLPRPIKDGSLLGREYKRVEKKMMDVICRRFGMPETEPPCIKVADNRILMTEVRDLLSVPPIPWGYDVGPIDERIDPWPPDRSEEEFLTMALALGLR